MLWRQTFEELMQLASSGTDRSVNQYTTDVNYASDAVENDDSAYVAMANKLQDTPLQLFAFGKAADSKLGIHRRHFVYTRSKFIRQEAVQMRHKYEKNEMAFHSRMTLKDTQGHCNICS